MRESGTWQKEKQESGREKEEDEVARHRQRTGGGTGNRAREARGGRVARGYTPYDGVGMRESALGRLRLEWRVWYVTMRAR